jgi:hypothetical protein
MPVGRARRHDIGHDDRDMVEPADHRNTTIGVKS